MDVPNTKSFASPYHEGNQLSVSVQIGDEGRQKQRQIERKRFGDSWLIASSFKFSVIVSMK
jgi:hypothetical protein